MIKYKCRRCGVRLETDDSLSGKEEPCPQCGEVNPVPLSKADRRRVQAQLKQDRVRVREGQPRQDQARVREEEEQQQKKRAQQKEDRLLAYQRAKARALGAVRRVLRWSRPRWRELSVGTWMLIVALALLSVHGRLARIESDVSGRGRQRRPRRSIESVVSSIESDVWSIESVVSSIESDVSSIQSDVSWMRTVGVTIQ